jgi:hypothetical protein
MKTTERQEARALMQWARLHPICKDYLVHYPMGGARPTKIGKNGQRYCPEGRNLKLEGARAGVSDYFLAYPKEVIGQAFRRNAGGMWIELKAPTGRASKAQIEWLERMERSGYVVCLAYGWESARSAIRAYLGESLEVIPTFIKKEVEYQF